jgi:excisionase family DNA binding protein
MEHALPKSEALRQSLGKPKQRAQHVSLTIPEACEHLRVSKHSIYRLLDERKLSSVRVLSRRLIPLEAIEQFIAHQQAEEAI